MTSLLRQIVAGPRARHAETGLDLCYVTDRIIATSGPSQTYPQRAYRNPLDQLVAFLDTNHGENWAIWEFRAEGTGYPDEAVYHRIRHYPWPDHHPPPFRLMPMIMASMRDWLKGGSLDGKVPAKGAIIPGGDGTAETSEERNGRVVVVHCKAGKGRSGTVSCSYLISECGWTAEDALARFTERRMRPKFGAGVSIPSQLRWITYVDRWTKGGKKYLDREIEIVEIHVWGLRNGVRVDVEAFADEGKKIEVRHTFTREERVVVEGNPPGGGGMADMVQDMAGYTVKPNRAPEEADLADSANAEQRSGEVSNEADSKDKDKKSGGIGSIKPLQKARTLKTKTASLIKHNSHSSSTKSLNTLPDTKSSAASAASSIKTTASVKEFDQVEEQEQEQEPGGMAVILKPASPIRIANSDVNISVERRNRANLGLTMVTAVAHVWFNTYFEGNGPEQDGKADASGVFEIEWDALDGIKGSSRKGTRALDRMAVVWRAVGSTRAEDGGDEVVGDEGDENQDGREHGVGRAVKEPDEGMPVPQMKAADWKGVQIVEPEEGRDLGIRSRGVDSEAVSIASTVVGNQNDEGEGKSREGTEGEEGEKDLFAGVKSAGPQGEELTKEAADGGETESRTEAK